MGEIKNYREIVNIYVIAAVGLEKPCKIGKAANVETRLMHLQIGSPLKLYVYGYRWCSDTKVERAIHQKLKAKRAHGEWFDLCAPVAMSYVNEACEKANKKHGHEIPRLMPAG